MSECGQKSLSRQSLYIGLVSAGILLVLAITNLDGYGLYYDEMHQVPASFAGIDASLDTFVALKAGDVPLLHMTYIGVIKSHLYRFYLSISGGEFDPISWRLLGILIAVLGIGGFAAIAAKHLVPREMGLLMALMLTDATLLLTIRHDLGPVALALCFRLLFAGLWLARERGNASGRWSFFFMGLLVGLSVFEKLSSAVLVVPLLMTIVRKDDVSRLFLAIWAGVGLLVGSIPLAAVNVLSFLRDGSLISLSGIATPHRHLGQASEGLIRFGYGYLSNGWGGLAREWFLGLDPGMKFGAVEAGIWTLVIAVSLFCWMKGQRSSGRQFLAFIGIGLALFLIPRRTFIHHWVIGVPFQYLGLVLLLSELRKSTKRSAASVVTIAAVLVLAGLRIGSLVLTEQAMQKGLHSWRFSPELTEMGKCMAAADEDTVFVAQTWGVGIQGLCFSGGDSDGIIQPYRNEDDIWDFGTFLKTTEKRNLYLVSLPQASPLYPEGYDEIPALIENSPRWFEVRGEVDGTTFHDLKVRRFVRVADKARSIVLSF